MSVEKAIFAAGCFWGVEHAFRQVPGVIEVVSGYTGGHKDAPSYKEVCTGDTGHAEAVEVSFDPAQVSYEDLLALFFKIHNPTQRNRQGPDIGSQYRSAIFYHTNAQKQQAERAIAAHEQSGLFGQKIVTEITAASHFWPAEEYHQRYIEKNGGGHCAI